MYCADGDQVRTSSAADPNVPKKMSIVLLKSGLILRNSFQGDWMRRRAMLALGQDDSSPDGKVE